MASEARIIGPPGTGKTEFIRRQVEAWGDRYEPEQFVLTSFTRSAASILKGRVAVPSEQVGTLHALAYRALGKPPIAEVGKLREEWNEQAPVLWQIGEARPLETALDESLDVPTTEQNRFELYNLARARLLGEMHPLWLATGDFAAAWGDFKRAHLACDFTDLLMQAYETVARCPGDPAVLIADEAQDFTPLQWALIRKWAAGVERFIVAGDPAQSLYSFAGASPWEMLTDVSDAQSRVLSRSYRLPETIQLFAEAWLARHSNGLSNGRDYAPRIEGGVVRRLSATWQHPEPLLRDLERVTEQEGKQAMVLASCAYMLAPLVRVLRDAGFVFHNPYRKTAGAWNPLGGRRAGVGRTVDRMLAFANPNGWTPQEAILWLECLKAEVFYEHGRKAQFLRTPRAFLPADDDGLIHAAYLVPLLSEAAVHAVDHRDLGWLAESFSTEYQRRTAVFVVHALERYGGLVDPPPIVVGTIHSVKGGEADAVYIFPDLSPSAAKTRSETHAHEDAVIRMGYVALTRAREEVVLCASTPGRGAKWAMEW